ncbi:DUF3592 domain-containing protein [Streptomyces sp. P9(2023)]|uniref:DUF3592 domain-containing protein n=1 Tax=Streptomyces sp. P9(2023) TaxID=3064394 RepID=UPI0028F41105|nr:DUF3592 domain-containing protein [Streptomyces sp. P9(2023)]MDT9691657.1 DUF3592 domain-containing protein [Streptomyces sp. P9(2023)]
MSDGMTAFLVCGACGLVPLLLAIREVGIVRRLRRDGIRTRGVVVDNVRSSDSEGPTWIPVIEFPGQKGRRVRFSPKIRGAGFGLKTGREVPVVYMPGDPTSARVDTTGHMAGPAVFLAFVGTAFLAVAVVVGVAA